MPSAGSSPRDLRAVVFDFDGVILESADLKTDAFLRLFSDHPEHLEEIRRHHLAHLGISRFRKFAWIYEHLLRRPLSDAESRRLGERFSELVFEGIDACPLVPGARELLEKMRGRLPAFVASGTPQQEVRAIVRRRGLAPYFEAVRGSPDPKPVILEEILERRSLRPQQVILVGDGRSDYEAAAAVGVGFVLRETEAMRQALAALDVERVRDLDELAGWLGLVSATPCER